jgi:hypothetical protein
MIALSLYGSWKQYRQDDARDRRVAPSNAPEKRSRKKAMDHLAGTLSLFGAGVGGVCMAFEPSNWVGAGAVT